jgi:hypothetical protein
MGFLDRFKGGAMEAAELAGQAAGQARDLAERAAARARQEAKELQLKRELNEAYDDLGRAAFDLWEKGEIASPHLESRSRRIKALREELEQLEREQAAGDG